MKAVTQAVPITVEADEAAYSLDQVMILVRDRIVDAISLKITKLGGLRKTYAAAQICDAGGVKYRMGAHVGPMLLAAHAMQLAAALPGIWYASELTEFDGLAEDPWEGLKLVDGVLHLSDAIGCGVTPKSGRARQPPQECVTWPAPEPRLLSVVRSRDVPGGDGGVGTDARRHPDLHGQGPHRTADRRRQARRRRSPTIPAMIVNQALRPLTAAFQKKYPFIKMTHWRGDSEDILTRMSAEMRANKLVADVIEGTGVGELAVRAGLAQPVWSPQLADIPEYMRDPRKLWAPTRMSYFGIAYNTRLVPAGAAPKTYEDLLDPKWKGKMAWPAFTPIGAPLFVTNLRLTWGEDKAMAYLQAAAHAEHRQFRRGKSAHSGGPGDRGRIPDRDPDFRASSADQRRQGRAGHRAAPAAGRERVRNAGHPQGLAASPCRDAADGFPAVQGGTDKFSPRRNTCRSAPMSIRFLRSRRSFRRRAGVKENFVTPENLNAYTESSAKIIEDLFR